MAYIAESRETAVAILQTWVNNICIYSDGSGYNNCIDATAVIPNTGQALQFRLGKMSCHTVFEGELVGVLLALHLLARQ